jgi:hypothetical protein
LHYNNIYIIILLKIEILKKELVGMNLNRTYGVEIEFIGDRESVAQAVREAGLDCLVEGYNHRTKPHWKVVTDSSVHVDGISGLGGEIVSPILRGTEGFEQIEKVCRALKSAGASVNITCGLHVHHDAQDFRTETFKNLIKIYKRFEPTIDELVFPSRRGNTNTYCQTLARIDMEEILKKNTLQQIIPHYGDRYRKLNLRSFATHGTVEFRQHQGTIDSKEIINWIKLTQAMVERAVTRRVREGTTKDWESFKYFLFLNPNPNCRVSSYDEETKEMLKYFGKRRKELAA